MKKIGRFLLLALAALLLLAAAGMAYIYWALPKAPPAPELTIELSPQRLVRGEYLANAVMGCLDCHAQRDFTKFTAPVIPGTEGAGGERWGHEMNFAGEMYAPNITPAALKNWSDGELFRAITQGINRDGKALFPIMPYLKYGALDREDIYAVIAYLRTIEPVENQVPERKLDFPLSLIVNTIPRSPQFSNRPSATASKQEKGAYLIKAAACGECHTPMEKGQFITEMEYAGGMAFPMPNGTVCYSSNLTPHEETGLGAWTEEKFIERFTRHRDGKLAERKVKPGEFNSIMPWTYYAQMTDEDLASIYAYLQSLEPIEHAVEKFHSSTEEQES